MPVSQKSAQKEGRRGPSSGAARASRAATRPVGRTPNRAKLSTTVASENFAFLETLVNDGRTESIAEAVDWAISRLRREENRQRLERATADYFAGLSQQARTEEDALAHHLHTGAASVDFDLEP